MEQQAMSEATNSVSRRRRRDYRLHPLVFELALAMTLCVWVVTLMAWALS
jgi:hypothetical protein